MNEVLNKLARTLPDDILFGSSFRLAKQINDTFNNTADKEDFVSSYRETKLKFIIQLASQASYYSYLKEPSLRFTEIPFIDKEIVTNNIDNMTVDRTAADYMTTGGTSGKPLRFYINKNRKGFEWFWMTNFWSNVGFTMKDYRAVLRNHQLQGKLYQVNSLLREYQFNNFALNDKYIDQIVEIINRHGIKYLHAYPSAAYIFAKRLKETKAYCTLNATLSGSENIFPFQKHLLQNELNIRMYTWFGHSEKLILAGEKRLCQNYHANPFYGYPELIGDDGKPVTTKGETGELTGTGFINTEVPFIRYRTGDFAEYLGDKCPDCGHIGLVFKNVKGRWMGDKIHKSDGSVVTTTALNLHSEVYRYIKNLQYYQGEVGKLEVRVIPEKIYTAEVRNDIMKQLKQKVGDQLDIKVVEVEELEYTKNKKFQLLIQKIPENQLLEASEPKS